MSAVDGPVCDLAANSPKYTNRNSVYSSENFQPPLFTFSSDDSSTDFQSDDSDDDSSIRRVCNYPPRGKPVRQTGKYTKRRPVYLSENSPSPLFTFSSDDSSTDSQSDDSDDDSLIRRACNYPPRGKPVRQTPSCTPEETSSDSSTDEELAEGENQYERFLLASQTPDENLFEWADRVMILAGKALKDTSESYRNRLSIRLFCLECVDREAGQYALYHHPETLDRALDLIIHYVRICRQKPWQASEANLARDLPNKEQHIAKCQSPIMKSPVCVSTKKQNSALSQTSIKTSPVCDFRKEQNITPNQPSINKSPECDPPNSTESANTAGKKQKTFPQNRSSKKLKKAKVKKTRAKRTLSTGEHPSELLAVDKSLQKTVESTPQKEEIASSSRLDDCILQEAKEQKTGSEESPIKVTWKDSIYLNCPSRVGEYRLNSTTAQISEEQSNSSLKVDELNGSQTNSIYGEPVTTTNVLTDDIEEKAILKTGVDQKRHPDEDLSVILEIDSTCLVNGNTKGDKIISHVVDTDIPNQEKIVAELKKNEAVCTSFLQWFEETCSISDVHCDRGKISFTEDGTDDSTALSFIEPPVILFGLKVRDLVVCNTSIEPKASTDDDGEIVSPCWNNSDFLLESTRVYKTEDLQYGESTEKAKTDAEEQQSPSIKVKEEENLPSEKSPIKEDWKKENLPSENSPIIEERKEENLPLENYPIEADRKEENLPSENSPIIEVKEKENLPSEKSPIKEDRKEENLPSENYPIEEDKKEEKLLSYADITGETEQTCLQTFWRRFLFLWVLGVGYVILLWHFLSLPYNYFSCGATSLLADASKGCSSTKDEKREEKNPECGDFCRARYIGLNLPSVGVDQNCMETGHPEFVSTGNESTDIDNNWATIDETGYMEMASLQTEDSAEVTDAVASDQSEHDGGWEPDGETEQPVARQWDPGGKSRAQKIRSRVGPSVGVPCWTVSVSVPCWTISCRCWTISECPVSDN